MKNTTLKTRVIEGAAGLAVAIHKNKPLTPFELAHYKNLVNKKWRRLSLAEEVALAEYRARIAARRKNFGVLVCR